MPLFSWTVDGERRSRVVAAVCAVDADVEAAGVVPDVGVDRLSRRARVVRHGEQALRPARPRSRPRSPVVGLKTDGEKTEGLKTEGLKTEGLNTDGENTEGLNTEGEKTEGRNTEGLNTEGLNTEGEKTDGANTDGLNAVVRVLGRLGLEVGRRRSGC